MLRQNTLRLLILTSLFLCLPKQAKARNVLGRLGVGFSQQLKNDIPSIDFKVQRSKLYAVGLLLGMKLNDNDGGWGAGLKLYRIIFDEPNLNFYAAGMIGAISQKQNNVSNSGFQVDATLGSEFSFQGLESIGLSFEMGLSVNKLENDVTFETVGNSFIVAAIHFYI